LGEHNVKGIPVKKEIVVPSRILDQKQNVLPSAVQLVWTCGWCKRRFEVYSIWVYHQGTHKGEILVRRPDIPATAAVLWPCGWCPSRFSVYSLWVQHQRTHIGY